MQRLPVARLIQRTSALLLLLLLPFSKAAIEILFPVLLGGWLLEHAGTRWRSSIWRSKEARWCGVALLAYLGACALSCVFSTHPGLSVRGFIRKTAEYALFFIIAADVIADARTRRRCVPVLLASALLVGVFGLAQELAGHNAFMKTRTWFYAGPGLEAKQYKGPRETRLDAWLHYQVPYFRYGRITGPYENPTDLATYLMVVLPISLAALGGYQGMRRWALRGLVLLLLWCFVRAESQGAWIGLLGGLAVLMAGPRHLRRLLAATAAVLVIGGGVLLHAQGRLHAAMHVTDIGMQDRLFMWEAAGRMIQDRPLVGQGLNTFMANYLTYWTGGEQQPRYAHNCFLQVAAETGLLGLSAFLWLLVAMARAWWPSARRLAGEPQHAALLGLGAGLAGFLVQSTLDTNFYALRQAVLFWMLAGCAVGWALRGSGTIPGRDTPSSLNAS